MAIINQRDEFASWMGLLGRHWLDWLTDTAAINGRNANKLVLLKGEEEEETIHEPSSGGRNWSWGKFIFSRTIGNINRSVVVRCCLVVGQRRRRRAFVVPPRFNSKVADSSEWQVDSGFFFLSSLTWWVMNANQRQLIVSMMITIAFSFKLARGSLVLFVCWSRRQQKKRTATIIVTESVIYCNPENERTDSLYARWMDG